MTKQLLTVGKAIKEIQARTGLPISKSTVYRQAALGKLPGGVRHLNRIYINVDKYVENLEEIVTAVRGKIDEIVAKEAA